MSEAKKFKSAINCCHCKGKFRVDDARFCNGHAKYDKDRRSLACPKCGKCACDHFDKWNEDGEIVHESRSPHSFGRFDWVHKDLIAPTK
jgi:hypothetical protein